MAERLIATEPKIMLVLLFISTESKGTKVTQKKLGAHFF